MGLTGPSLRRTVKVVECGSRSLTLAAVTHDTRESHCWSFVDAATVTAPEDRSVYTEGSDRKEGGVPHGSRCRVEDLLP